jgi:hypothetical protein
VAVNKAIARVAGAVRGVLIGVQSKDIPDVYRMRVKLLRRRQVVNAACNHAPVMTVRAASNLVNAAAAGQENEPRSAENNA